MNLINATPWPSSSWELTHTLHFAPTIDGWVLPDAVDNLFRLHQVNPVSLIIVTNADDETTLFADANMTLRSMKYLFMNSLERMQIQFSPNIRLILPQRFRPGWNRL